MDDVLAPMLGPLGFAFAAAWGAIWGSFFGLCVVRVPRRESILGRSRCRACGAPVAWYHNLPVVSWLWLRARCAACGARISPRYLVVEISSVALSLAVWGFALGVEGPIWFRLVVYLVHFFFCGTLLVLSFIDLATLLLPNAITYPAIPIFTGLAILLGRPWKDALIGAVAAYAGIWLLAEAYVRIRKREGMGLGDAKLLALVGGFLGWQALIPTLFLASLQGSVIGIAYGITRKRAGQTDSVRFMEIPFGPFLSLGALQTLLLGDWLGRIFPLA